MDSDSSHSSSLSETLDPENWDEIRKIGHQMIDDMMDHMQTVRERPVWQPVPNEVRQALAEPVPFEGSPLNDVYTSFQQNILPYPTGNAHPRFFGWVMGNGTATGALADFLASAMNCQVAGFDQAAALIENRVLDWLTELMGYPSDASGLLVSGGTMANINGVLVARNEMAGFDVRAQGIQDSDSPRLTIYGSSETHGWIINACEVMGLGREAFRQVPVNSEFQIDVAACQKMIEEDLKQGFKPICIIGNVGTVNTGAIDDLQAIRDVADQFGIWFHVDGAFGSMVAWSAKSKHRVEAQSCSDSIAFDLHKWGYMPYEAACVLVRKPASHNSTFAYTPSYLTSSTRGISVDATRFADRGLQLSRSFRALKIWMSMKTQGVDKIGRIIDQNIQQACYLKELVEENERLELLAPVSLNIICFRYVSNELNESQLDEVNQEILLRIQESGLAVPSQTVIDGKFAIRVCITNHRSRRDDFVQLADAVVRHGDTITAPLLV